MPVTDNSDINIIFEDILADCVLRYLRLIIVAITIDGKGKGAFSS
jgi:hypothetical protein